MTSEKENFNTTFYRFEATIEVQNLLEVAMHAKTFEKIKNIKEVLGSDDKPVELQDKPGKLSNDLFDELFGDKKW